MTSTSVAPALEGDLAARERFAGRRAIVRWAWRMFRREWRGQVLVVALLTLAIAGAVGGSAAVHGVTSSDDDQVGRARQRLQLVTGADRGDGALVERLVHEAEEAFGTVEVIGEASVPLPATVDTLELRAQDPDGPFGAPLLDLREGTFPSGDGEVALTDGAAARLGAEVGVGDRVEVDGVTRSVVGMVENPTDLDDEFALLPVSEMGRSTTLSVLVDADEQQVAAFRSSSPGGIAQSSADSVSAGEATALTLGMSTVVLLLVSLIAAAGFVVLAQRRQRQLGTLAALGADERHLRLVVLANGFVVGLVAAVAGTALGVAGWIVAAPHLEAGAGHRIDRLAIPAWLVAAGMVLAVVTALAAAWWPARVVARVPITQALSARPSPPEPVRRSLPAAAVLVVVGVLALHQAFTDMRAVNGVLVVVGVLGVVAGVLLTCPTLVQALPTLAGRLPVAGRLALRDLGRHQARAAAALAAISLGLGIPVATVVISSAVDEETVRDAGPGNLPDDQLLLNIGNPSAIVPERSPDEIARLQAAADRLAAALGDAEVVPIDAAVDPRMAFEGDGVSTTAGRASDLLGEPLGGGAYSSRPVGVATPEVLALAGLHPDDVDPATEVLTSVARDLVWINQRSPDGTDDRPVVQHVDGLGYTDLPTSLVPPAMLSRLGLQAARSGWLIAADRPLTPQQLERAHEAAEAADLFLVSRRTDGSTATLRTAATGAGVLVALGILAMTVGLLRSEAAADLRTLAATGASSRVRRTITATTAATLAALGAVLGTVGAYLALIPAYAHDLALLGRVPGAYLAVMLLALPLAAAAAAWLLAGRDPPLLATHPTD